MLDNTLFDLLKEVSRGGGLQPDSKSPEDRKAFDRKVERIISLRDQGYLRCRDEAIHKDSETPDFRYDCVLPEGLTELGHQVLDYGSFEEYAKHVSQDFPTAPVIDHGKR